MRDRLQHAWNAFVYNDNTYTNPQNLGGFSTFKPDRVHFSRGVEKSIVTSVYNRLALDVASLAIKHVRLDENGRYMEEVNSGLQNCLNVEANIDQTGRAFLQDVVMSMLDEGCVAIVPVDTTVNPAVSGSYEINTMRTGKILEWYPAHVRIRVYNDKKGIHEELTLPK